ncbi:S1 RNA-binding domain-containing protein [bacterium]|nr:S1 RNA-binding domain-containing protein [bacterium]
MDDVIARAIKDLEQKISTPTLLTEKLEEEEGLEHLLFEKHLKKIKQGNVLSGVVVEITGEGVLTSVGGKQEGIIPLNELSLSSFNSPEEVVKVGEEVDVIILSIDDKFGNMILSKKRCDLKNALDKIASAFKAEMLIEGRIISQVKGGLLVDVGVEGFIPASHTKIEKVRNLDSYLEKTLKLKIIEFDRKSRRVILSIKEAEEEGRKKKQDEFFEQIKEGQRLKGEICKVAGFGAFVSIGDLEGLIPISELSYRRIKHPKDVVRVGDIVDVVVLNVDRIHRKVSLSLKETQPSPWEKMAETLSLGSTVEGKVVKIFPNYAFVEVADGVDGFLPKREMEDVTHLKEGNRISVKIIDIDSENKRMVLSAKSVFEEEERKNISTYLGKQERKGARMGEIIRKRDKWK